MKQIIAMGGGGFSMEPANSWLDVYVLKQTGKRRPQVCFFPHATDDAVRYGYNFHQAFTQLECVPSVLSLYQTPPMPDMGGFLLSQDVIYVGGGNTKSMLALWREWGMDHMLRQCYEQGVVLAGVSAGANCWFESFITDSATPELSAMHNGLGFLAGSFCPHYDSESKRQPLYQRLVALGEIQDGIACDDGVAAHFVNGKLHRVVSSRLTARGYSISQAPGRSVIRPLDTLYLGDDI